jgi:mRNA (guanine-N7-)-methyltransferase
MQTSRSNVDFYLNDVMRKRINSLNSLSNQEIEFRFGTPNKTSEISQANFKRLTSYLSSQKLSKQYENSLVEIDQNLIRKISSGTTVYFEKKIKKDTIDCVYEKFNLRLSVSEESIIPEIILFNPTVRRERFRTEYSNEKTYKYVLTEVIHNNTQKYEFEIEFLSLPSVEIAEYSIGNILGCLMYIDPYKISCIPKTLADVLLYKKREIFKDYTIKEIKPINLTRQETPLLKTEEFSVTNKLDGEHFFVIFCEEGVFAINHRTIEYISDIKSDTYIIDTEYYQGVFYIFDLIIDQNINLIKNNKTHLSRVKLAQNFNQIKYKKNFFVSENISFKVKDFRLDLVHFSKDFLSLDVNFKQNDGLIFTSKNGLSIKKWKYPEKMTLDFLIKFVRKTNDNIFNIYELYLKDTNGMTIFHGSNTYPLTHPPIYFSKTLLQDQGIYEFGYDKKHQTFIFFRQRPDKNEPNYYPLTGISVWDDIMNPYTKEELLQNLDMPLDEYRKYHNNIKRELIDTYCKGKTILDLGIGRGGDVGKYEKVQIEYLWGVEPNEKNYSEFLNRLEGSYIKMKNKTKLIVSGAENNKKILDELGGQKVDIIASFFSLSFFFFNEKLLDNLVNTISQNLKGDGLFIGTTIDGKSLKKLLIANNNTYSFDGGKYELLEGNQVKITMKGTIVETQIESLVDFDQLTKKLQENNIKLIETKFFDYNNRLTQTQNIVSRLYRKFIFQKYEPFNLSCDVTVTRYISEYCKIIGIFSVESVDDLIFKINQLDIKNKIKLLNNSSLRTKALRLIHNIIKKYFLYSNSSSKKLFLDQDQTKNDYSDLKKIKDWRKILSISHVCPFTYNGYTWNTIENALVNTKRSIKDITLEKYKQCFEAKKVLLYTQNAELWNENEHLVYLEEIRDSLARMKIQKILI